MALIVSFNFELNLFLIENKTRIQNIMTMKSGRVVSTYMVKITSFLELTCP